ncbi:Derlin, partial [Dillenia turbinata]
MSIVPFLWSRFLVFMIAYIWGREFPNAQINIYGLVMLKGFHLPWAMLAIVLFVGNSLKEDMSGIMAGHSYYFLTGFYPFSSEKYIFETSLW